MEPAVEESAAKVLIDEDQPGAPQIFGTCEGDSKRLVKPLEAWEFVFKPTPPG